MNVRYHHRSERVKPFEASYRVAVPKNSLKLEIQCTSTSAKTVQNGPRLTGKIKRDERVTTVAAAARPEQLTKIQDLSPKRLRKTDDSIPKSHGINLAIATTTQEECLSCMGRHRPHTCGRQGRKGRLPRSESQKKNAELKKMAAARERRVGGGGHAPTVPGDFVSGYVRKDEATPMPTAPPLETYNDMLEDDEKLASLLWEDIGGVDDLPAEI